ncbi:LysR family transcriptional regulator [Neptuniibacter sp.]|uniref:LysR family transcriptional regulator n=1 Tax=Neptuniibacter sp. TaxID=1962643 RepID=UPI003B5B1AA7
MNRLSEMQAFTESVGQGSFSAASRSLGMSPSAISKLVTRLEERLQVRLLNRTTRQISLTEAGQRFYVRCNEILNELEDAETEIVEYGELPQGVLRVNCSPGFAQHQVIPLLADFHAEYPGLQVELTLTGKTIDLIAEGVDLAIRLGELADSSLIASSLGRSDRIVCAAPMYLEKFGTPQTPQDLKAHNCLCLTSREEVNIWKFGSGDQQEAINVSGNFKTDNVNALYDYALAGGGILRLSGFMLNKAINAGQLVPLLSDYEAQPQWVNIVYPHRRFLPAKVRLFIEYLKQNLDTSEW